MEDVIKSVTISGWMVGGWVEASTQLKARGLGGLCHSLTTLDFHRLKSISYSYNNSNNSNNTNNNKQQRQQLTTTAVKLTILVGFR